MKHVNRATRPVEVIMKHKVSGLIACQYLTDINNHGHSYRQTLNLSETGLKCITMQCVHIGIHTSSQ